MDADIQAGDRGPVEFAAVGGAGELRRLHEGGGPQRASTVPRAMTISRIRPAGPADTSVVLRLMRGLAEYERLLHEATATEAELHEALFGPVPSIHAVIAEVDATPIGLALFYYTFNTFKARRNIFLEDLFVEAPYRGTGAGLALMRHLARRAVAENCGRIEWRVLNWNQPSIDFYHRIGAEPIQHWHTLLLGGDALARLAEGNSHG